MNGFDTEVQVAAAHLRALSRAATEIAAGHRGAQQYVLAETFDRRAEALECAALVAEGRGLQS